MSLDGPQDAGAESRSEARVGCSSNQDGVLKAYLLDPTKVKPGTTMPHVLASIDAKERVRIVDSLLRFSQRNRLPSPN